MNDLVTIGAMNYNNEAYVLETLESIKRQTYNNIELIIVDDCSTDGSVELIKKWLKNYDGKYQFILHEENKGLWFGCNELIQNAKGKYLSIIATDDILYENKIEKQIPLFNNDDIGLVYSDVSRIDSGGNVIHPSMFSYVYENNFLPPSGDIHDFVIQKFYFYSQACLYDLEKLKSIGFSFSKEIISEDWDIELAITKHFKANVYNAPVVKYRKHNASIGARQFTKENNLNIWKSHFHLFFKYYSLENKTRKNSNLLFSKLFSLYVNIYVSDFSTSEDRNFYLQKLMESTNSIIRLLLLYIFKIKSIRPIARMFKKRISNFKART